MTYTNRRRTELNQALLSRLQKSIEKVESESSTHIYLGQLPAGAERVEAVGDIKREIPHTHMVWDCVVPVFIPVSQGGKKCYAVGYVNRSDASLRMANEKIASNGMFFVPGLKLEKGADYERV